MEGQHTSRRRREGQAGRGITGGEHWTRGFDAYDARAATVLGFKHRRAGAREFATTRERGELKTGGWPTWLTALTI
jgi:hypothetical protein